MKNENILHLEYKESLTPDYARNYLEIIYDETKEIYEKIYFYNSEYGTIQIVNNKKNIHKWETEDQAQKGSYLNRNYPIICLNGVADDIQLENNIIEENLKYIKKLNINEKDFKIIDNAIQYLRGITNEKF